MEKISLGLEEEKNFTKNNEGHRIYTHKNDNEMENITSHASTYFPTSHTNIIKCFYFHFSCVIKHNPIY